MIKNKKTRTVTLLTPSSRALESEQYKQQRRLAYIAALESLHILRSMVSATLFSNDIIESQNIKPCDFRRSSVTNAPMLVVTMDPCSTFLVFFQSQLGLEVTYAIFGRSFANRTHNVI